MWDYPFIWLKFVRLELILDLFNNALELYIILFFVHSEI